MPLTFHWPGREAGAELQCVNSLRESTPPCGPLRGPRDGRLIVLREPELLAEPSEWAARPFEVSPGSDLLLMDSVFQADGVLKTRQLTNDNVSDLLREGPHAAPPQPPSLANYIT